MTNKNDSLFKNNYCMKIKRLLNLKYYHIEKNSETLILEENNEKNILISGKKNTI